MHPVDIRLSVSICLWLRKAEIAALPSINAWNEPRIDFKYDGDLCSPLIEKNMEDLSFQRKKPVVVLKARLLV